MIVMALDHTRDFFNRAAFAFQPLDLTKTTTAIFLTRWITHFCAPTFMFTAGMAAYFWLSRGHTKKELSAFLVKRGLWLMLLELTAVRFALTWGSGVYLVTVLWGLGTAMIMLALLVYLPIRWLAVVSVATIALHNLADGINLPALHTVGMISGIPAVFAYPLVPWFAVMAAGFCFGEVFTKHKQKMVPIGLGLTTAFLIVRGINIYGDPVRWSGSVLSFLNANKNPPSLDFVMMTLGPSILVLAFFDKLTFSKNNPLIIFGRVPLFYFLTHLYLIHLLTTPFAYFSLGKLAILNPIVQVYPQGFGYSLRVTYLIWIGVVIALYPLCLWYSRLKARRSDSWLSYL